MHRAGRAALILASAALLTLSAAPGALALAPERLAMGLPARVPVRVGDR